MTEVRVRGTMRLTASRTTVIASSGNGIYLSGDAVARLTECGFDRTAFSAVHLAGCAELKLERSAVAGSLEHGVRATESSPSRIDSGRVTDSGMSGISTETSRRVIWPAARAHWAAPIHQAAP